MQLRTLSLNALAVAATGVLGGLASRPAQSAWYASLKKPSYQPPRQAFPIVWPILYADIAAVSASTIDDLDALVGVVAGVNVKLTKCGGVGPALAMMRRARELGFRVMLGCMEETSVGIAAAAALAGLAEWVDLDGNLLLAYDPWPGVEFTDGVQLPSNEPGLGVREAVPDPR